MGRGKNPSKKQREERKKLKVILSKVTKTVKLLSPFPSSPLHETMLKTDKKVKQILDQFKILPHSPISDPIPSSIPSESQNYSETDLFGPEHDHFNQKMLYYPTINVNDLRCVTSSFTLGLNTYLVYSCKKHESNQADNPCLDCFFLNYF